MAIIAKAISPVASALGLIKSPGKAPTPLPAVTRDDARDQATMIDDLRRRRGGAADILTGSDGAELVGGTGKTTLG